MFIISIRKLYTIIYKCAHEGVFVCIYYIYMHINITFHKLFFSDCMILFLYKIICKCLKIV